MYRFQLALVILTLLPLMMAFIGAFAITPKRQKSMDATLEAATKTTIDKRATGGAPQLSVEEALQRTREKLSEEFHSLYRFRMLVPATFLCILYFCMLSLGVSALPLNPPSDKPEPAGKFRQPQPQEKTAN